MSVKQYMTLAAFLQTTSWEAAAFLTESFLGIALTASIRS